MGDEFNDIKNSDKDFVLVPKSCVMLVGVQVNIIEVKAFPPASLVIHHSLSIEILPAGGSVDGGTFGTFDYFENDIRVIRLIEYF